MSGYPNRPGYGASPRPWSPPSAARGGAPPSPGRWTPGGAARPVGAIGSPRPTGSARTASSPQPARTWSPVSVASPSGGAGRTETLRFTPVHVPPPASPQTTPGSREARPAPSRLFSPSRLMSPGPGPGFGRPPEIAEGEIVDKQTQEYVDEKLAEFQAAIHHLQDEQERVQKKTFLNWINSYLKKHMPPMQMQNLIEDLKDGSKLLALLQVLSGQKLPVERGRILKRPHFLSNANTALQFLQSKNIKLVNINPSDIVDGRPAVVLGLIWTVILYFQIEENTRALEQAVRRGMESRSATATPTGVSDRGAGAGQATRGSARTTLLKWARTATKSYGIEVQDFGRSWRDGKAFVAIVHCINPTVIDVGATERMPTHDRLDTVFKVAEEDLGVARLLDPEDVDVPNPDEKSIMTYVAQFLHKYPEPHSVAQPVSSGSGGGAARTPQQEVDEIAAWVTRTSHALQTLRPPDKDDFLSFKSIKNDASERYLRYEKLKTMELPVPANVWDKIDDQWYSLESLLSGWLEHLDSRLPPPLLSVAQWIHRAETFLEAADDAPTDANERTAKLLTASLEQHMTFFNELPRVEAELEQGSAAAAAAQLPPQQLAHLNKRLRAVRTLAHKRWVRLKYLEHRCCIIAFLILLEGRVRAWSVKLGRQPRVEQMLHEYRAFVSDRNVVHEFEQAFVEMQQVADAFVQEGGVVPKEREVVVHFINEVGERWRSVSVELQCLRSMLEEVLSCWSKLTSCSTALDSWMDTAEQMLGRSEDDQLEFFQDLPTWVDREREAESSGSFLVAACEDEVAADVADTLKQLQTRWQNLFKHTERYLESGQIRQRLSEFSGCVQRLQTWLHTAQSALEEPVPCRTEPLEQRSQHAQSLLESAPALEADLKAAARALQSLSGQVSAEKQQQLEQQLRTVRDGVSGRSSQCQQQTAACQAAADRLTAMSRGHAELADWVAQLSRQLDAHQKPSDADQFAASVEDLRAVLGRHVYCRSLLDSSAKMVAGLLETVSSLGVVDTAQLTDQVDRLNQTFSETTARADARLQELEGAAAAWERFEDAVLSVTEWLDAAERMLAERPDTAADLDQHKSLFYEAPTERLSAMSDRGRELLQFLPPEGQESLQNTVARLHQRWQATIDCGPAHLVRLETLQQLRQLSDQLQQLETQLAAEEQQLQTGCQLQPLAQQHEQTVAPLMQQAELRLADARESCAGEEALRQLAGAEERWRRLQWREQALKETLQQAAARWTEYTHRLQQTGDWLERVESAVQPDPLSIADGDQLDHTKQQFQVVFSELTERKQTLRWLVSTLDSLTSALPEPEAERERQQLSALVTRYKDAVPRLETSAAALDAAVQTRHYRLEVDEFVQLLFAARAESSAVAVSWQSAQQLADCRQQQQRCVQTVQEQRPRVLAALQRGRDLCRDLSQAPAALAEALSQLEAAWTETNQQLIGKLDDAKETERLWTELEDRRADLQFALSSHQAALAAADEAAQPASALAQLTAHLQTQRPETSRQLQLRLRQLADQLQQKLEPQAAQLVQQQVDELEAQLETITDDVEKKKKALTAAAQSWEQAAEGVDAVRRGLQSAQRGQQRLVALDMPPEARRQQLHQLQQQLHQLTGEKHQLQQSIQQLNDDGYETGQLSSELAILEDTLQTSRRAADQQHATLEDEYTHWQNYQQQVSELSPWLEWAEEKVAADLQRPAQLQQAAEILQQCQQFEDECTERQPTVKALADESAQMVQVFNVSDEADALVTRWTKVHETALVWVGQMQSLVAALQGVQDELATFRRWLEEDAAAAGDETDGAQPVPPDAAVEMKTLQLAASEAAARQQAVAALQRRCEQLAELLTPEGAAALRDHVAAVRAEVTERSQHLRQRQAHTADAAAEREEVSQRVAELAGWLEGLRSQLTDFDRVQIDSLWDCLTSLSSLQHDLEAKLPACEAVRRDADGVHRARPSAENARLLQDADRLCRDAQQARHHAAHKHQAVQLWTQLTAHSKRLGDQLAAMADRLQAEALSEQQVPGLQQQLALLQQQQQQLEQEAAAAEPVCRQAQLAVVSGQREQPPAAVGAATQPLLRQLLQQLEQQDDRLAQRQQIWDQFSEHRGELSDWVEEANAQITATLERCQRLGDLPTLLNELQEMKQAADERTSAFHALQTESQAVLEADPARFSEVHGQVASLERAWSALRQTLAEADDKAHTVQQLWTAAQHARQQATAALTAAEAVLEQWQRTTRSDAELETLLVEGRSSADILSKTGKQLSAALAKVQSASQAARLTECLEHEPERKDLENLEKQCDSVRDKLAEMHPQLESAHVLWAQTARSHDDASRWCAAAKETISAAGQGSDGLRETQARLEKCRQELTQYQALTSSAGAKVDKIKELLHADSLPVLEAPQNDLVAALSEMAATLDNASERLAGWASRELEARKELALCTETVMALRDRVASLDNGNESTEEIISKINQAQECVQQADRLDALLLALQAKLDSADEESGLATLKKEHAVLLAKVKNVRTQLKRVMAVLTASLEKKFNQQLGALRKLQSGLNEQLSWLMSSPCSDAPSLQNRRDTLAELTEDFSSALDEYADLVENTDLYLMALPEERRCTVATSLQETGDELKTSADAVAQLSQQTNVLLKQWEDFSAAVEKVEAPLTSLETLEPLHHQSSALEDLVTLQTQAEQNRDSLASVTSNMEAVSRLAADLAISSPECVAVQQAKQLESRRVAQQRQIETQLKRLAALSTASECYRDAVKTMTDWLEDAQDELRRHEAVLAAQRPTLGQQQQLKTMREQLGRCHEGQQLLSAACAAAEPLLVELPPAARELVRAELRQLRDDWEKLEGASNQALKRLEALVLQLSSFDDCFQQVSSWLDVMEASCAQPVERRGTLAEKASVVQEERARRQEVAVRRHMVDQLREKADLAGEEATPGELTACLQRYDQLESAVAARVAQAEQAVNRHQQVDAAQQALTDWLNTQKDRLSSAVTESQPADTLLTTIDDLTSHVASGTQLLDTCESRVQAALSETAAPHTLDSDLVRTRSDFDSYVKQLDAERRRLQSACQQQQQQELKEKQLGNWLNGLEAAAAEAPPLDTPSEKAAQVARLESLCAESSSRAEEVRAAPALQLRAQQVQTRLQERTDRLRRAADEHAQFDRRRDELISWLQQAQQQLQQEGAAVGQLAELRARRRRLDQLSDERCRRGTALDDTLAAGERLYAHTGPLGRDTVRAQIAELRDAWERVGDQLQASCALLDGCLQLFAEFSSCQEQLARWLAEVEQALVAHAQLRATLPEKQAQLQSHELTDQEIGAHQPLVGAVCERARQLISQTGDTALQGYLTSIPALFDNIRQKSQEILQHLQECVRRHEQLQTAVQQQHAWLEAQREQLSAAADPTGEPAAGQQRRLALQKLQQQLPQGRRQMKLVHDSCVHAVLGTSEAGGATLQAAVRQLDDQFKLLETDIAGADNRLRQTADQWSDYEKRHKQLASWCGEQEQLFSQLQLQATLDEKEAVLCEVGAARRDIVDREPEVDQLIDAGNDLAQLSALDRVKAQVKQLSARYQELHVTSQSLLTKWQNMVDDQRAYQQKLEEMEAWLRLPDQQQRLEDGQHLVSSVCTLGERLFANSSAAGRDSVRAQLKDVRQRWDARQAASRAAQQEAAARSDAESAALEAVQRASAWLDTTERMLHTEPANWLSTSDVRAKLHTLKTADSDEPQYRRLLEAAGERRALLSAGAGRALQAAGQRLQTAAADLRRQRHRLESLHDQLTVQQEAQRAQQEWLRTTQEQVSAAADTSGGRAALVQRLSRADQLMRQLAEPPPPLAAAQLQSTHLQQLVPERPAAQLQRELQTQADSLQQLQLQASDAQHALQSRLGQWSACESVLEALVGWLNEAETTLKNHCNQRGSLEQKEEQLKRLTELAAGLQQQETRLEKLSADARELGRTSGDSRIVFVVQQAVSRAANVSLMTKDLLAKCEESVQEHRNYAQQYTDHLNQFSQYQEEFAAIQTAPLRRQTLQLSLAAVQQLLAAQPTLADQLASLCQLGERLYASTAADGRQLVQQQLQQLQTQHDQLFDQLASTEKQLQLSSNRFSGYEEAAAALADWLEATTERVTPELQLQATLDEKCEQLQTYRLLLHDLQHYQQVIADCKEKASQLPDRTDEVTRFLESATEQHRLMLDKVQCQVESYEGIVADHQQYTRAVLDAQEFLESTHGAIELWGRPHGELSTIRANLDKLKTLQSGLKDESGRVSLVQSLGERVIPNTSARGQQNVRAQIETTGQEWQALVSAADAAVTSLQRVLDQWANFERMQDQWASWLQETEARLHAVALAQTLPQKRHQLDQLQAINGEVRARELEIDALADCAHTLTSASGGRQSQHAQIIAQYQRVAQMVKDLVSTWQQYVASHSEFSHKLDEASGWQRQVQTQLQHCSDLTAASQQQLHDKLAAVKDLLLHKEDGHKRVHALVELGHEVLRHTEPAGHAAVAERLQTLQHAWTQMANSMAETKTSLEECIQRWSGFLDELQRLQKSVDRVTGALRDAARFQTTMAEKRAQLDRLTSLEESLRCEKFEVDALRQRVQEMSQSGGPAPPITQANQLLGAYDQAADRVKLLRREREEQYKHHRSWKQAYDEFQNWMTAVREKVPAVRQRHFGDRSATDGVVAALDSVLGKQPAGQLALEQLVHTGDVMMASTSEAGQREVRADVAAAQHQFDEFFNEIGQQKRNLETIESQLQAYREESERLSDWLQSTDVQVKQQKTVFAANLDEKQRAVAKIKDVCRDLEAGGDDIAALQASAAGLLASHLEAYVSQQLRHLTSKHQVQVNLAKDVERKLEQAADQHVEFEASLARAGHWMERGRTLIRRSRPGSGSGSGSSRSRSVSSAGAASESGSEPDSDADPEQGKAKLEKQLKKIQELMRNQDEGQMLIHQAASLGEKVLRNTHPSGREDVKQALKQLQSDWDRFVKKLSNAKVQLETSLLQWTDSGATYAHLHRWISDREARLQQVLSQRTPAKRDQLASLGEKKAALRRTNSIMQDIVSFQPMIASVTCAEPRGRLRHASEISDKYQSLTRQAQQAYEQQKRLVERHGAFIDAAGEFIAWLQTAGEQRTKCAEPAADRDALAGRMTALKLLEGGVAEGERLLETSLQLAEAACAVAEDDDDREVIEEQVAQLQTQMDNYKESVACTRQLLESGVVKWAKYEERLRQCREWLQTKDAEVQTYHGLLPGLQQKQASVEAFQTLLSDLYEWQTTLDDLNLLATLLLDSCADGRITSAVTQLTTQYNALQSHAKDAFRRLEVAHLEHKQHSALCHELDEWVEKTREKLSETEPLSSKHSELLAKLHTVHSLRTNVEQGLKKLRYAMELKERVMGSTAAAGAERIQQDADALQAEFDHLTADIADRRNQLQTKIGQADELGKANQTVAEMLSEVDGKTQADGDLLFDELRQKRTALEKYRALDADLASLSTPLTLLTSALQSDVGVTLPEMAQTVERHASMQEKVQQAVQTLESRVQQHEQYAAACAAAGDWLRATRQRLQLSSEPHGSWQQLQERRAANQAVMEQLPDGSEHVAEAARQGELLQHICTDAGHHAINKETQALQTELESLQALVVENEASLSRGAAAWREFSELHDSLRTWLDEVGEKAPENASDGVQDDGQLQKVKSLLTEVTQKRRAVDDLSDKCELLIEMSGQPESRQQTALIQADHAALLDRLQGVAAQLERRCQSEREVSAARAQLVDWLQRNVGTVSDCCGVRHPADTLTNNLEMLTLVATRMTEGRHLVGALQKVCARAAQNRPDSTQQELTEDATRLRDQYEQLTLQLQQATSDVKSRLRRWEEAADCLSGLETRLQEASEKLETAPSTADPALLKTSLDKVADTQRRLESGRSDVERVRADISDLCATGPDAAAAAGGSQQAAPADARDGATAAQATAAEAAPSLLRRAEQLQTRWEELVTKCSDVSRQLQTELEGFNEYTSRLHAAQKWLLQVSYQLMGQNSQYISSREQTAAQIQRHQEMLSEFDTFAESLRRLEELGGRQVSLYKAVTPQLEADVDKQLENVRSSYSSLRTTAEQIQSRLLASLAKFEQYEQLLESIGENLTARQSRLDEEAAQPITDLETAHQRLDAARSMHNELQSEKARLDTAVQICEAATASISRPSSPGDQPPQTVPERELQVRCQLELLIDQMQSRISELQGACDGLQRVAGDAGSIGRWAAEQATLLGELAAQRARLQPEPAAAELQRLRDLQRALLAKHGSLDELDRRREEFCDQPEPQTELRQQLDRLTEQVSEALCQRSAAQACVEEYTTALNALRQWHQHTNDALKGLDGRPGGATASAEGGLSSLADLQRSSDEQAPALEKLAALAEEARGRLAEPEAQLVAGQVLSVQRSCEELRQRLQQKTAAVRSAAEQADRLLDQLRQLASWCQQQQQTAAQLATPIGYTPEAVENRLQQMMELESETKVKRSMLAKFGGALSSLAPSVCGQQSEQLRELLQQMESSVRQLLAALETQTATLRRARSDRQRLQRALADVRQLLADAGEQLQLPQQLPLTAEHVQTLIDQRNTVLVQLESLASRRIPELRQTAAPLAETCSDEDKQRLQHELDRIAETLQQAKDRAVSDCDQLANVHASRTKLESTVQECRTWLQTAQVALREEPLTSTSLTALQEHAQKMSGLRREYDERQQQLAAVLSAGEQLLPELRPPDQLQLTDTLSQLRAQYSQVGERVSERAEAFRAASEQQETINKKIASSVTYLTEIKKEIKQLNKPVGTGVEDAQTILSSYEEVLQKLRQFRDQLESLQQQTVGSISDLNDLIRQQDELVRAIENQVAKLRSLVLLRQQFLHLLTEVNTFLTNNADVVTELERTERPVPEKITQYTHLLSKVQEVEALLASAQDKGEQISAEGTVTDRNAILRQLQSLHQQVSALRRAVLTKRTQYEQTVEHHTSLSNQLTAELEWMKERDADVRSRPMLSLDDADITKHTQHSQSLCDEVRPRLGRLASLLGEADALGPARELPAALQQQLAEARGLTRSLPTEMDARHAYLQDARRLVDDYRAVKLKVSEWARQVGESVERVEAGGLSPEQREQTTGHCQVLMSEESTRRAEVAELQALVDRLLPLLAPKARQQLDSNQRQLSLSYDAIVQRAGQLLQARAQRAAAGSRAAELAGQLRAALRDARAPTEPPSSARQLQQAAAAVRDARARLDSRLPQLSELQSLCDATDGDTSCIAETEAVHEAWRQTTEALETATDQMDDAARLWKRVEEDLSGLESSLGAFSRSVDSLQPAEDETDAKANSQTLQTLRSELAALQARRIELEPHSTQLLSYLQTSESPAQSDLDQRVSNVQHQLNSVTDRLEAQSRRLTEELTFMTASTERMQELTKTLEAHRAHLSDLDPYASDAAERLQELEKSSSTLDAQVASISSDIANHYSSETAAAPPRRLTTQLTQLHQLRDSCEESRSGVESELSRAVQTRADFEAGCEEVSRWAADLDTRLQTGADPQQLRQLVTELQAELAVTGVSMAEVARLADLLQQRCRSGRRRDQLQQEVQSRAQLLETARAKLERRRLQVEETLDSWSRFLELHETVREWLQKQNHLVRDQRCIDTLQEARDAHHEYQAASKECKWATRKLHEMATELSRVSEISNVETLTEKMTACERDKIEAETLLKEKLSLLSEMSEEWEQCEHKMAEVQTWCDASRAALQAQQARRRPLRDQLAFCEKLSSDNGVQRTRLAMAVDKLGVHFRTGYFTGASVAEERRAGLETSLAELQTTVDEHCQQLAVCVTQLEQYQQPRAERAPRRSVSMPVLACPASSASSGGGAAGAAPLPPRPGHHWPPITDYRGRHLSPQPGRPPCAAGERSRGRLRCRCAATSGLDDDQADLDSCVRSARALLRHSRRMCSDVQTLRGRILDVDQQLRAVSQPAHMARDRDAALAEQQDCRERIRALHAKVTARGQRIKLLVQRAKPDPEPLPPDP